MERKKQNNFWKNMTQYIHSGNTIQWDEIETTGAERQTDLKNTDIKNLDEKSREKKTASFQSTIRFLCQKIGLYIEEDKMQLLLEDIGNGTVTDKLPKNENRGLESEKTFKIIIRALKKALLANGVSGSDCSDSKLRKIFIHVQQHEKEFLGMIAPALLNENEINTFLNRVLWRDGLNIKNSCEFILYIIKKNLFDSEIKDLEKESTYCCPSDYTAFQNLQQMYEEIQQKNEMQNLQAAEFEVNLDRKIQSMNRNHKRWPAQYQSGKTIDLDLKKLLVLHQSQVLSGKRKEDLNWEVEYPKLFKEVYALYEPDMTLDERLDQEAAGIYKSGEKLYLEKFIKYFYYSPIPYDKEEEKLEAYDGIREIIQPTKIDHYTKSRQKDRREVLLTLFFLKFVKKQNDPELPKEELREKFEAAANKFLESKKLPKLYRGKSCDLFLMFLLQNRDPAEAFRYVWSTVNGINEDSRI